MKTLVPGENCCLTDTLLSLSVKYNKPCRIRCFYLDKYDKALNLQKLETYEREEFVSFLSVDLSRLPKPVRKVTFACDFEGKPMSELAYLKICQEGLFEASLQTANRQEKAVIIGECYHYRDEWKFRLNGQGFKTGMDRIAECFGVKETLPVIVLSPENPYVAFSKKECRGKITVTLVEKSPKRHIGRFSDALAGEPDSRLEADFILSNQTRQSVRRNGDSLPYARLSYGKGKRGNQTLHIDGSLLGEIGRIDLYVNLTYRQQGCIRIALPNGRFVDVCYAADDGAVHVASIKTENKSVIIEYQA